MSYSEYKDYGKTQLAKIFNITIDLSSIFAINKEDEDTYSEFQHRIDSLATRTRIANTNKLSDGLSQCIAEMYATSAGKRKYPDHYNFFGFREIRFAPFPKQRGMKISASLY